MNLCPEDECDGGGDYGGDGSKDMEEEILSQNHQVSSILGEVIRRLKDFGYFY